MRGPAVYPFTLCALFLSTVVAAQDEPWLPGGLDSVETIERIVEDTIIDVDEVIDGRDALGNWEPYTSVVGNRAFLIESNTFAEDPPDEFFPMQRYALAIQPVDGSEPAIFGECFFDDDGNPYRGPINNYRQNGNPGRVAGDKRPGAVNFITGGEASPNEYEEFQSDDRWEDGIVRMGRFATVQTFALERDENGDYAQVSRSKAFDALHGRLEEGDPMTDQIGRFGGELAGLDNGNFVVVIDDRSGLHNDGMGTATSAVIVAPDGSIVKDTWVIVNTDIWSNVAAHRGGFVARVHGILYFYDNEGELVGERDQDDPDLLDAFDVPITFGRGREDGSRIAGHINSPYVFIAGTSGGNVYLAAYDSRDLSYAAQINVNELTEDLGGIDDNDFLAPFDRIALAVDALNRVVVTYEARPETLFQVQTFARVIAFSEDDLEFEYLTPSFLPFVNHDDGTFDPPNGVRTWRPNPSMTTKEICIAAKGEINSQNEPENGPDTPLEVNFYTVISHPDPQDDPTPPVPGLAPKFLRGDANSDGAVNIADAQFTLNFLFLGGPALPCEAAGDSNSDAGVNIADAQFSLNFLFLGGPAPTAPFPECAEVEVPLSCEDSPGCP